LNRKKRDPGLMKNQNKCIKDYRKYEDELFKNTTISKREERKKKV